MIEKQKKQKEKKKKKFRVKMIPLTLGDHNFLVSNQILLICRATEAPRGGRAPCTLSTQ
jgi:hypothetical protein